MLVQLAKPPIEVTAEFPTLTWFEASTEAWKPTAVLLVTAAAASANAPMKVLEKLLLLNPAPRPKAALLLPLLLSARAAPPATVLLAPVVFEYNELYPTPVLPVPLVFA